MSIVKVIEVIAEGATLEKAAEAAIMNVSKTIHDIKQIDIEHFYGLVENNKVVGYRVNAKVSFVVT